MKEVRRQESEVRRQNMEYRRRDNAVVASPALRGAAIH